MHENKLEGETYSISMVPKKTRFDTEGKGDVLGNGLFALRLNQPSVSCILVYVVLFVRPSFYFSIMEAITVALITNGR